MDQLCGKWIRLIDNGFLDTNGYQCFYAIKSGSTIKYGHGVYQNGVVFNDNVPIPGVTHVFLRPKLNFDSSLLKESVLGQYEYKAMSQIGNDAEKCMNGITDPVFMVLLKDWIDDNVMKLGLSDNKKLFNFITYMVAKAISSDDRSNTKV